MTLRPASRPLAPARPVDRFVRSKSSNATSKRHQGPPRLNTRVIPRPGIGKIATTTIRKMTCRDALRVAQHRVSSRGSGRESQCASNSGQCRAWPPSPAKQRPVNETRAAAGEGRGEGEKGPPRLSLSPAPLSLVHSLGPRPRRRLSACEAKYLDEVELVTTTVPTNQ